MTQPPQDGPVQGGAGPLGGHPEPEPVPEPDPDPPQPIPPPDPVPAPEPPHAAPPADFLDGEPPTAPVDWPPVGAYPGEPGHPEPVAPATHPPVAQPMFQPAAQQVSQPAAQSAPEQPTELLFPATRQEHGWHQPPPTLPWHAQHERPDQWNTEPPEHLAWQHSPPAETGPEPVDPIWAGHPPVPPGPPWQVPPAPVQQRSRRGGLWVSLALTVILLFCGGGAVSAYFLISNADTGKGAPDPATAVNRFLTAVYTQQDVDVAEKLICRQARDKQKLTDRVNQIKNYANEYDGPTFRWSDPSVSDQTQERAMVSTQLTLSTDDEKQAQQALTFTTVHKTGWLVCDIAG
jgi:hypothetical protein